jgi:2-phosphosulfolactate phosphatase
LRPALEDWIGAGAILRQLPGPKSPDADAAIAAFEHRQRALVDTIAQSSSGRQLIDRGFPQDVELASALDLSTQAPKFDGLAFTG